ncbi:long-chain fatty acid--CoA ligase, partial [Acinetobacter baumannii]
MTTIQVRMEDSSWLKRLVYKFFMALAISAEKRKLEGGQPTLKQWLLSPIGEWLVYGPIKDQFGLTRLRGAFTG